ncbi:LCP family protein [Rathayibacter sp. YIM 133350]|uniref:LCP family protein n=1 Tax=Rathayibacter sp. YIM 133350 TaxID=3131992 RepID=UPI00307F6110
MRHGRLRPSKPMSTLLGLLGIAVCVLLVSGASVVAIALASVTGSIKPTIDLDPIAGPSGTPSALPIPEIGAIPGGVNLLVVGSDSGQGDPQYGDRGEHLGDVTMLMHIANDHSNATVVSFPRDLFVRIPECDASEAEDAPGSDGGTDKLNTALSYGGLACTARTISQLTGLEIPYAATIEFNGVVAMSNAVGGVPVCVAEKIEDEYTGLFLDPGMHTLQGIDALQFLRTRHGIATGSDTARISNQQVFLASLARTIKSNDTLTNPLKLYGLAKAAADNMTLSTSLNNITTMVSIAKALADIPLDHVSFVQYPSYAADGGLRPREDDADVLMQALAADQPIIPGATGEGSQATDGPSATPETPAAPAPSEPAPTEPGQTAAPSEPVQLPESITGQTAAEQTCSVGRTLDDQ